jgi:CubicO group peptidase (beta-lactamase class C family)
VKIARIMRITFAAAAALAAGVGQAAEPAGLHEALERLERDGRFSGAVVVRGADGARFARGYGMADPFTGRAFTPETPADSASLAKPFTAAAVLLLAQEGRIDLDAPVQRYLPGYPHPQATVRQLLSHSAGLPVEAMVAPITGKTNEMFVDEIRTRGLPPLFPPGAAFVYCNLCYTTLALLVERVTGTPYLDFVRRRLALPRGVTIRPPRLADWSGRAIGYRRMPDGSLERSDSDENELFYGAANFSISASQLARWGAEWWRPRLRPLRAAVTAPATINAMNSGLTLGNWYCAQTARQCHYLGHHQGFHHMLYWDAERRISVAMISNNTLAPGLQQRLQRALVAFASGRPEVGRQELEAELPDVPVAAGTYSIGAGPPVAVTDENRRMWVARGGVRYLAFPVGQGIRYIPGLDVYLAGTPDGGLRWLSLYEDAGTAPATGSR